MYAYCQITVLRMFQLSTPWTLSPLKTAVKNEPSFLEMSFPDDEDDDEYCPNPEELEVSYNDMLLNADVSYITMCGEFSKACECFFLALLLYASTFMLCGWCSFEYVVIRMPNN